MPAARLWFAAPVRSSSERGSLALVPNKGPPSSMMLACLPGLAQHGCATVTITIPLPMLLCLRGWTLTLLSEEFCTWPALASQPPLAVLLLRIFAETKLCAFEIRT